MTAFIVIDMPARLDASITDPDARMLRFVLMSDEDPGPLEVPGTFIPLMLEVVDAQIANGNYRVSDRTDLQDMTPGEQT